MSACILPLTACLVIESIKVVCALFISLASAIALGNSCGWFCKKFLVKLGSFAFSVLSYGKFNLSNAFAIDRAALYLYVNILLSLLFY